MAHIDWISFTVPMPDYDIQAHEHMTWVKIGLNYLSEGLSVIAEGEFIPQSGRAPYRRSWHDQKTGITIFTSNTLSHALIEISGAGCAKIGDDLCINILQSARERLTRLDIAVDMHTGVTPAQFAEARGEDRFKSHSSFVSATGETFYIGARASDRFCRIYRYNAPHERAHLLRAEFQLKKENARNVVEKLGTMGVDYVASMLGNVFSFEHEAWKLRLTEEKLPAWRGNRTDQKTIFWLHSQVAPVLRRLANSGEMDVLAWVKELLGENDDKAH